ncbi:hypothetical protein ENUP19_0080G0021 [Entamoeba nuttalli]|uniref:TBC domain containing protein n=2 Tax=Entamoeba nuttalli TaxID=412467 RepID=K2GUU7_ENTNP|nr:TBC domain containing protein [Entamoeba nuttalli P19]EKE38883.1 TBC domain containing protein [Entamoeba nuttalli P19]|eukprot:XP_008858781.1 TBC domain containing protein [Entamoeba nuttalli P19]
MLTQSDFWKLEEEDSLLLHNDGYLTNNIKQNAELIEKANEWYEIVMSHAEEPIPDYVIEDIENVPEGISRIIYLDVFRTLKSPVYQNPLIKLLTKCWKDFGDYAQPMCLVAAFLRLTLSENKVYKMLHVINKSEFYIPGYWKAQATGYASDAYTAMEVSKTINPSATQKILQIQPFPETFCQKFFTAIGIHVFPFCLQFDVMDKFIRGGRKFLIQLICSVIDVQGDMLLNTNAVNVIFELLRLDKKSTPFEVIKKIVEEAEHYTQVNNFDIVKMRQEMYDLHLKKRLERPPIESDSDDEIILSDDSSEDDNE